MLYFDAVGRFLVEDGNVGPFEEANHLHDGHHLVMIRRNRPGEIFKALLVTQFGTGREEGNLLNGANVGYGR
jgi:hypothetical protein